MSNATSDTVVPKRKRPITAKHLLSPSTPIHPISAVQYILKVLTVKIDNIENFHQQQNAQHNSRLCRLEAANQDLQSSLATLQNDAHVKNATIAKLKKELDQLRTISSDNVQNMIVDKLLAQKLKIADIASQNSELKLQVGDMQDELTAKSVQMTDFETKMKQIKTNANINLARELTKSCETLATSNENIEHLPLKMELSQIRTLAEQNKVSLAQMACFVDKLENKHSDSLTAVAQGIISVRKSVEQNEKSIIAMDAKTGKLLDAEKCDKTPAVSTMLQVEQRVGKMEKDFLDMLGRRDDIFAKNQDLPGIISENIKNNMILCTLNKEFGIARANFNNLVRQMNAQFGSYPQQYSLGEIDTNNFVYSAPLFFNHFNTTFRRYHESLMASITKQFIGLTSNPYNNTAGDTHRETVLSRETVLCRETHNNKFVTISYKQPVAVPAIMSPNSSAQHENVPSLQPITSSTSTITNKNNTIVDSSSNKQQMKTIPILKPFDMSMFDDDNKSNVESEI